MTFTKPETNRAHKGLDAGFTLIEMIIALGVVSVILAATTLSLQKESESISDMQRLSHSERLIQDLFTKIEQRLDFAQGIEPTSTLDSALSGGATGAIDVTDVFGFPNEGMVVIEPGGANAERVSYAVLSPGSNALETLTRAERGTAGVAHPAGSLISWEGVATPTEDQVAPAAGTFDGQTNDLRGPIFYRGDGVGFCYRKPVDPAGTGSFIGPAGIRWGATISGTDNEDAVGSIVYEPVAQITELQREFDINQDGDLADTFELGRIRDIAWNAVDPALGTSSLALVTPIILQELDNYGSDLDGDGFLDPMFLWTPESGRLRIRFFALLGDVGGREVVKRFETVLYLRNGAAE